MATEIARVQRPAPAFEGTAVINGAFQTISNRTFTSAGQWLILGFIPMAWTFVCPTEILAFSNAASQFKARGAEVVFASTDSEHTLLAWSKASRKDGGLGGCEIPLLSDRTHKISRAYGVLLEEEGIALRGLFVIDPRGVVRQITINDLPVGRSVDETLRLIDAFKFTEEFGEVCPVNWQKGQNGMQASLDGVRGYMASQNMAMEVEAGSNGHSKGHVNGNGQTETPTLQETLTKAAVQVV